MRYTFEAVFSPEDRGGFTVEVPALPGCISYGEDFASAVDMIHEAMELWIEVALLDGREIPAGLAAPVATRSTMAISVAVNPETLTEESPILTVAEAAEILGVSSVRVNQLIHDGALDAEKVGRDWLIDRMSIIRRFENPGKPGRPTKAARNGRLTSSGSSQRYNH